MRLTDKLISARPRQGQGAIYSFVDTQVTVGSLYYYRLKDIDIYGKHTEHGPICVDWDADSLPDDWEITHGLSPWVNDADLDDDGDGLTNFEEYERGLDPFNADSDGDGIPDGREDGRLPARDDPGARSIGRGVEVLSKDDSGLTIVLNTGSFDSEVVTIDGQEYEQLSIAEYVHGYTAQVGYPQMPLKGILVDVPEGKAAQLTIIDSRVEPYGGYRIYPVPAAVLDAAVGMAAVGSAFVQDDLAYSTDGFYPDVLATLGQSYVFRDQLKQQVIFYPIGFNPATGKLKLHRRIELRIDYVDTAYAQTSYQGQTPWQPSGSSPGVLAPIAVGLAAAPALVNPVSPLLSSLGAAIGALWSPPEAVDGDVYKIITDAEGIYQIGKDWLDTNGVDTAAINLSRLRLYNLGQEVAIEVYDQNGDDQMDVADYFRFYAQPVSSLYAKYSDRNVYWLTLSGGSGAPLRMGSIAAGPAGGPLAVDFADTAQHELNQTFWLKAPGADSIERWFFWTYVQGDQHAGGGLPKAFTINAPDPTSSGTLTILMAGQTDTEHEVEVAINGVEQRFTWSGIRYFEAKLDNVPLGDGDNAVTLQCLSADGNDSIIVDWFKIDYWRDYVAIDNQLKFTPDSGSRFVIDGFSSNSLFAYDISDPLDAAVINNPVITGPDPYYFEFEPTVYGETYLVLSADSVNIPVGLIQDRAAYLADNANGADYILITHRDVGWDNNGDQLAWLADLVAHREAQGLRVFVADIEDIYDEFSYGIQGPHAVKDFLAYAYSHWTPPAPRHVLLVGDSTYDPKDHWNEADSTAYLPTYLMFTDFKGATVSDQWFVTFSGDDAVADMHIGRLPAADATQAAVMVAKIIDYETAVNSQTWQNDLLLIADNQRPGAEYLYEADFETMNEEVAALIPEAMADPFRGYLNEYAATAFLTDDIIDTINDGVLIANYAGHGATQILAEEHIFDAADVAALANSDRLPFFVSMACEAGFFAYPETWNFPSLAEALLRSDAGAMAAFMPTGMTSTGGQQVLDAALFEAIFKKDIRTLGPAIADAKQTLLANGESGFAQVSDTFLLFGDPATKLKIPLPHVPTGVTAEKQEDTVTIRWDAVVDCNDNPVAGYNIYRAASAAGPFSKINIGLVTDTLYVDSEGVAGMAAGSSNGSSYYAVSAVDNSGFESVQSLAVKPPAATESAATEVFACFIATATQSQPEKAWWMAFMSIAVFLIAAIRGQKSEDRVQTTADKKRKQKAKKMNAFDELKQVKTLLVDDDEFIRNSLELAFKTKGCALHVAESAEEGLQAIKAQHFDIIISDLRLPGMNGLDFLKLTSVTHPDAIRFLITAYRDDHILSKAIRSGIDQFIDKPFAVNVLVNLLALALKKQMKGRSAELN
jgi:CheY-like chemotaxis protein